MVTLGRCPACKALMAYNADKCQKCGFKPTPFATKLILWGAVVGGLLLWGLTRLAAD